jgi:hypothetical protein
MEPSADEDAQVSQFFADLEGTEWSASVSEQAATSVICLHIERPSPTSGVMVPQVMELCRASLAAAIKSARIHIFKPSAS